MLFATVVEISKTLTILSVASYKANKSSSHHHVIIQYSIHCMSSHRQLGGGPTCSFVQHLQHITRRLLLHVSCPYYISGTFLCNAATVLMYHIKGVLSEINWILQYIKTLYHYS